MEDVCSGLCKCSKQLIMFCLRGGCESTLTVLQKREVRSGNEDWRYAEVSKTTIEASMHDKQNMLKVEQ